MRTKVSLLFDKRKVLTTGLDKGRCHIKIIGSFYDGKIRTRRYFKTQVFATLDEFKRITSGNAGRSRELQEKQTKLFALLEKAKEVIKHNPYIDFESFENQLTSKGSLKDPIGLFQIYIDELNEEGRIGSRDSYKQALSCFQEYADEKHGGRLLFATVTDRWLMRWEKWMIERGRTITTVRIYVINLRRIFNLAINRWKIIPREMYPFGEDKYVIPSAQGRKLALDEAQKNKLLKYATLNIIARKGVDFWVFSYFCNGMNMADVCGLRFRDLPEGFVIFDRVKTRYTQRNKKSIVVISRAEIKAIIARWGNKPGNPNDFVFPVLRDGLTAQQIQDRIHDFIAEVNSGLAAACADLQIPKITTYSARHTYATILKNKGASISFLKEALGHADERTTENYLDSFDIETKQKMANLL